jgi:hypothetical protein
LYSTGKIKCAIAKPPMKNPITATKEGNCWICGEEIVHEHPTLGFECEHVFPIAQALAFTGLYEHSLFQALFDENSTTANAYKTGLELEYKPSHRYCNQIKNDAHFIKIDNTGLGISRPSIQRFLHRLSTSDTFGGWQQLHMEPDNILSREQPIYEVCTRIIDRVNSVSTDPTIHAKNTAIYLQEYIAADPNCGIAEIIPNITPISPQSGHYTDLQKQDNMKLIHHSLDKICNYLFGSLNTQIDQIIKSLFAARDRAQIKGVLFDLQLAIKRNMYTIILPIIDRLRDNLMLYLLPRASLGQVWSLHQVLLSQLIPMVIMNEMRQYFIVDIHTLYNDTFKGYPKFQDQLKHVITEFLPFIKEFLDTNAKKVYPVIFQTHVNYDPASDLQRTYTLILELSREATQDIARYPNFYVLSNGSRGTIPIPLGQGGYRTRRRKRVRRRNTRHR